MTSPRRDFLLTSAAALFVPPAAAAAAAIGTPLDRAAQLAGPAIASLDFAAKRYSGPAGSVADPVAARLLTVTRNAPGYAQTLAGRWTPFAANVLRVTDRGALIERAATNYAQNGALGTGGALPAGWYVLGKPAGITLTVGPPVVDADTGLAALPVNISGTNQAGQAKVELHVVPRVVQAKAGDIWVGSSFVALKRGALPANARLFVQVANGFSGLVGNTAAAWGSDLASEIRIPADQTKLDRLETNSFTVVGANGSVLQCGLAFDLAAGAAVDVTLHLAMPQLERVPDTEARATSPILNFDVTGLGTTRPADMVALTGSLLAVLAGGQGTIAATLAGTPWRPALGTSYAAHRPLSSVVPRRKQAVLGVNGLAALQREAHGGVSSALGGKPGTFRAQITNWANAQAVMLTWGAGKIGVCSTACANYAIQAGAFPAAVTSVTLGSGGDRFLDGYLQKVGFGPGYAADLSPIGTINAEVVVYGAKPGGICAAYRAAAEGRRVAILGDWREIQPGGMMSGGLGATDVVNAAAYGGLGRYLITRINQLAGWSAGVSPNIQQDQYFIFQPRLASAVFDELLARSGVNVYWTTGVTAVPKTGTRITALVCGGARTYGTEALTPKTATGKVFIGSDYEGDIMPLAGIAWTMGREAAATYNEGAAGYRGIYPPASVNNFMFPDSSGNENILTVDPWVVPGNPASGPLQGVTLPPAMAVGDADPGGTQAYTFRATMTQNVNRLIPLPSTPPAGFDASEYELFLRFLAAITASGRTHQAGSSATTTNKLFCIWDLMTFNGLNGCVDINTRAGVSTDYVGKSAAYVNADYATREKIWQAHASWFLGLWYVLQHHPDARVPAGLRAEARGCGLDALHYQSSHPNDLAYWSPQLYVREARRMVGSLVWNLADVVVADGTTPRSPRTIAAASYSIDSHHFNRLPWNRNGTWTTWSEGGCGFFSGSSFINNGAAGLIAGADKIAPLPLDAFLSKQAECSNYAATFAGSVSHMAFGFFRMELASAAVGEAIGLLAAMACEPATQPDLQTMLQASAATSFSYATLRGRLLASPAIALGGKVPVAPLVN